MLLFPAAPSDSGAQAALPIGEQEPAREHRLAVLQNRKYVLRHELSFLVGTLPVNPYYKGLTGTAAYTWHMTEWLAWQVGQFTYSYNFDTSLKREVMRFGIGRDNPQEEFPEINWFAASHLVLKPLYGKQAWLNTDNVHLEAFVQAGPAFVSRSDLQQPVAFGADVGAGLRLWLSQAASFRLDVGELFYLVEGTPQFAFHLRGGIAFTFGGGQ